VLDCIFGRLILRLAQTTNSPPDILQLFLPPAELTELIIAKNKNLNPVTSVRVMQYEC
jgi:hypothetical protein